MCPLRSDSEAVYLQVAIDLLERSDAYAATEPLIARQYARQAYELGQRSRRLRQSITQERIRMIVQHSSQCCIAVKPDAVPLPRSAQLWPVKKTSLLILLLLAGSLLSSTPVGELSDERITLAGRFINAPL